MATKKYFSPFDKSLAQRASMTNNPSGKLSPMPSGGNNDFQSQLPQVYTGPPNRIERYTQYDHMDLDSQISSSLDIIAEFCTQSDDSTKLPFYINYKEELTSSQVNVITSSLKKWCTINNFQNRIYDIIRNTIKYGDTFFVKDPETSEWLYIFPSNLEKVTVYEAKGKTPESYWIKEFDYNSIGQAVTRNPIVHSGAYPAVPTYNAQSQPQSYYSRKNHNQYGSESRFSNNPSSLEVGAEHVVHLSMNTGLDPNFPFGTSILERVYKTFKQKELLEDSIIIYRIQRAPERRIFYIDVGDLPENRAMQFVERMKNEIHQRRIPTKTRTGPGNSGGSNSGQSIMDATYNPLSVLDDYFFPQCLSLETLIELVDGRVLTLADIINEYEEGKINEVYSVNFETKEKEVAKITWAGVTRKNAEVYRVGLSNGEYVQATPDHKFILKNGSEILVENLKKGDELLTLKNESQKENIKVFNVFKLDYKEDTCDITVEGPSNSHVFSLYAKIFVHNSSEGRGSRVETLAGGDTRWGLDELQYFDNKLGRGLRVPVSYLPTGLEESNQPYSDGRVGTALIQEVRFSKFCERIQNSLVNKFDEEFKLFLKMKGVSVSSSNFNLQFNPPQNYAEWRKIELDSTRISNFTSVTSQAPYISKRLALKEYLGWGEDMVTKNTSMYSEENPKIIRDSSLASYIDKNTNDTNLQDIGFNPSDYANESPDFDIEGEEEDDGPNEIEPSTDDSLE